MSNTLMAPGGSTFGPKDRLDPGVLPGASTGEAAGGRPAGNAPEAPVRTERGGLFRAVIVVGLPVLLLLLTHLLVAERSVAGTSRWLSLSPDTAAYVELVRGGPAIAPFTYRRLVPWVASLLPLPPTRALWVITQVSVVTGYAVLLGVLIGGLRLRASAACLTIVIFMTSTRSLLMLQNPFVVDGFSFLMMTLMLAAFLANKPTSFGLAAVTGILAREDCLFGAVGFLAAHRRLAGVVIAVVAVVAYAVPRWLHPGPASVFLGFGQLFGSAYYAKAYFAFGFIWPLSFLGLWLIRATELRRLLPYFGCVLAGSFVSTLFAVDTTRMFLPVLPVAVVACAVLLDRLRSRSLMLAAWWVLALANLALALPNALFPGSGEHIVELEDWYRRLVVPIALHQVAGIVLVVISGRAAWGAPSHGPAN